MIVYRMQDNVGRGPWKLFFSHKWIEPRPDHENLKPWFEEMGRVDLGVFTGEAMACGCISLDSLRRWFTPTEYAKLLALGYQCVQIEGRILGMSETQVVFAKFGRLSDGAVPVDLYPAHADRSRVAATADVCGAGAKLDVPKV